MKKYLALTILFTALVLTGYSQGVSFTIKGINTNTIQVMAKPSAAIGPVVTGISNVTFVIQIPQTYANPQGNWGIVSNPTYLGSPSTTTSTSFANGSMYNTLFSWTSNPNIAGTTFAANTEYLLATLTVPAGVLLTDVTIIDWGNNRLNNAISGAPIWATSLSTDGIDRTNNATVFYSNASTFAPFNSGIASIQSTLTISSPLSIKLLGFEGKLNANISNLQWTVANEKSIDKYEVLYSTDAANWSVAGNTKALNTPDNHTYYFNHDSKQLSGSIYYRLRILPFGGAPEYSNIVRLNFNGTPGQGGFAVYPTFMNSGDIIHVESPASNADLKIVRVTDQHGRVIRQLDASSDNDIKVSTSGISSGSYILQVFSKGKVQNTTKFVVN